MHEEPKVSNFVTPEQLRGDFKLKVGTTIAVEPMVVMGRREVVLLEDKWTVVTEDRQPAAHFEHTVAVTESGCEILTNGSTNSAPGRGRCIGAGWSCPRLSAEPSVLQYFLGFPNYFAW
jgi:Xaa-Pro aminopeptidase